MYCIFPLLSASDFAVLQFTFQEWYAKQECDIWSTFVCEDTFVFQRFMISENFRLPVPPLHHCHNTIYHLNSPGILRMMQGKIQLG